jgi:RHS repeat-associated protein
VIVRNLSGAAFAYRGRQVAPGESFFDLGDPCAAVTELVRVRAENPGVPFAVTQETLDFLVQCPQLVTDPAALIPPDPLPPPGAPDPPPPSGPEETNTTLGGIEVVPVATFAGDPPIDPPAPPPPGERPGPRSRDEEAGGTPAADPVDLFSGEFVIERDDFELPAPGIPLVFRRRYRSGREFAGPFGYNWDHSYNLYLRELADGRVAVNTGALQEHLYADSGDGVTLHPPRGVFAILERAGGAGGVDYVLTHRGGLQWVFARPPGWPEPARIPVIAIREPRGNAQALHYDASGRLSTIVDTVGRRVSLVYGECGLLEALRPEFLQRDGRPPLEIRYLHAATVEHLSGVVSFPTDTFPEGLLTCYDYDEAPAHQDLRHNIVRVVDARGRTVVENVYGADPGTHDFNRVVRQYFMGGEYLFRYHVLRPTLPFDPYVNDAHLQTEIYEPARPLKVLTFNFRGNLLDERSRLCADGSYRLVFQAFRYNRHGQPTAHYQADGTSTHYTYDENSPDPRARANLLAIDRASSPNGLLSRRVRTLAYEPAFQRLKTSKDEAGQETRFVYDYEVTPGSGVGDVVQVIHPDAVLPDGTVQSGCVTHLRYGAFGQVVEVTSPEGRRTTYTYHPAGRAPGQVASIELHDQQRPLKHLFAYDDLGRITSTIDGAGHEIRYQYDLLGQLTRIELPPVDGSPAVFSFDYDADRKLVRERLPRGAFDDGVVGDPWILNEFEYDLSSLLVKERRHTNTAHPQEIAYCRDAWGNVTRIVDPLGREHRFRYDERDLLLEATRFANTATPLTTTYRYDRAGRLTTVVRPDATETRLDYSDPFGRLRAVVDHLGVSRIGTYGVRDELASLSVVGPQGQVLLTRNYGYDEKGRLVGVTVGGLTSRVFHDRDDLVTKVVDPAGATKTAEYDGAGRPRRTVGPTGVAEALAYDAVGNVESRALEFTPAGGALVSVRTSYQHDARRRLASVTDPVGNVAITRHDDRDVVVGLLSPVGTRIAIEYDALRNPIRCRLEGAGGASQVLNTWHRDRVGRLTAFEDAEGHATQYAYDALDNITAITSGGVTVLTRTFDAANHLASETDANGTVTRFAYNAARQVESLSFATQAPAVPTPDVTFGYDAFGRRDRVDAGGWVVRRKLDAFGRIVEDDQGGSVTRRVFDDVNRAQTLVYPDGREDLHAFDAAGRLVAVTHRKAGSAGLSGVPVGTRLAEYVYEGPLLLARKHANGTATVFTYGSGGGLRGVDLVGPGGAVLQRETVLHDGQGRRALSLRPAPLNANRRFRYDALGRLRGVEGGFPTPAVPAGLDTQAAVDAFVAAVDTSGAATTESYDLTLGHRRTSWVIDGVVRQASYDGRLRLTGVTAPSGQTAFANDANGNRVADGQFSYRYDALDRLVAVLRASDGQPVLELDYDGLDRVRRRVEGGTVRTLRYDGLRCIQEDGASGPGNQTVFGGALDEHLVSSGAGGTLFHHQDPMLTLRAVSDAQGRVVQWFDIGTFGQPAVRDAQGAVQPLAAALVRPCFGGRPYLATAGLYCNRKRHYDHATGLFLQADPLGCADGGHQHLYAHHDPVNRRDALGLAGYAHSPYVPMTDDEHENLSRLVGDTAFGIANAFAGGAPARITAQENLGTFAGLRDSGVIGLTTLANIATFGFYDAILGGIGEAQTELTDWHFATYGETAGDDPLASVAYRVLGTVGGALVGSAKHLASFIPYEEAAVLMSDSASTAAKWEAAGYGISKAGNLAALGAGITGRNPVLTGETARVGYAVSGNPATRNSRVTAGHAAVTVFESFFDKNGNGVVRWFSERPVDYRVPEMAPNFFGGRFTYAEHTVPAAAADRAFRSATRRWAKTNAAGGREPFGFTYANCSHFASQTLAHAGIQLLSTVPKVAFWNFTLAPFLGGTLLKTSVTSAAAQAAEEKK